MHATTVALFLQDYTEVDNLVFSQLDIVLS